MASTLEIKALSTFTKKQISSNKQGVDAAATISVTLACDAALAEDDVITLKFGDKYQTANADPFTITDSGSKFKTGSGNSVWTKSGGILALKVAGAVNAGTDITISFALQNEASAQAAFQVTVEGTIAAATDGAIAASNMGSTLEIKALSTFTAKTISSSTSIKDATNTITVGLTVDAALAANDAIVILMGANKFATVNDDDLAVAGTDAAKFGSEADWVKSTGAVTLTVASSVTAGTAIEITFDLTNVGTAQAALTPTVAGTIAAAVDGSIAASDLTVTGMSVSDLDVTGVDTTTIATGVQKTLTFTTLSMVSGSEPWFKITASNVACTAADGDADAIGTWAAGKLTFVNEDSGTFAITAPHGTAASTGNKVCWGATKAGSYAAVGSAVMATTVTGGFAVQPAASEITNTGVKITVTPNEDVNVTCGVFARNATAPTAAEVYAGTGTGGAATGATNGPVVDVTVIVKGGVNTAISGTVSGLTKNTEYDVYCATNDATKTLSSPVVQFSTTNTATATTAAPISGASTGAVWSAMVTVLALMGVSAML